MSNNTAFKAIQTTITKALKQTIRDVLHIHYVKYGSLYDEESNVLEVLAKQIRERVNKRFGKAFRSIPFKGKKLEKFLELPVLGVWPFREFDERKELYINDDDLYEIIMSDYEWTKEYKNIMLSSHDYSDDDD